MSCSVTSSRARGVYSSVNTLHMHPHPAVENASPTLVAISSADFVDSMFNVGFCVQHPLFRNLGHDRLCHCRVVMEEMHLNAALKNSRMRRWRRCIGLRGRSGFRLERLCRSLHEQGHCTSCTCQLHFQPIELGSKIVCGLPALPHDPVHEMITRCICCVPGSHSGSEAPVT